MEIKDRRNDRLLNKKEAAKLMNASYPTFLRWIEENKIDLPTISIGGNERYWESDLYEWLEKSKITKEKK